MVFEMSYDSVSWHCFLKGSRLLKDLPPPIIANVSCIGIAILYLFRLWKTRGRVGNAFDRLEQVFLSAILKYRLPLMYY